MRDFFAKLLTKSRELSFETLSTTIISRIGYSCIDIVFKASTTVVAAFRIGITTLTGRLFVFVCLRFERIFKEFEFLGIIHLIIKVFVKIHETLFISSIIFSNSFKSLG